MTWARLASLVTLTVLFALAIAYVRREGASRNLAEVVSVAIEAGPVADTPPLTDAAEEAPRKEESSHARDKSAGGQEGKDGQHGDKHGGKAALPVPGSGAIVAAGALAKLGDRLAENLVLPHGLVHASDATCYSFNADPTRCAPHWVIIGALKCGTTSVYAWLAKHPNVAVLGPMKEDDIEEETDARMIDRPLQFKETGFFNGRVKSDMAVKPYLRYFPTIHPGDGRLTGEGSVGYIFNHASPEQLKDFLPRARYILLLRDPIERVFSRFQHTSTLYLTDRSHRIELARLFNVTAQEGATQFAIHASPSLVLPSLRSVQACLDKESSDDYVQISMCWKRSATCPKTPRPSPGRDQGDGPLPITSIVARFPSLLQTLCALKSVEHSVYYVQVAHWRKHFPAELLGIFRSEDLFRDGAKTMARIASFVGLPEIDWAPITNTKYNVLRDAAGVVTMVPEKAVVATKYPFPPEVREAMTSFYKPTVLALEHVTGMTFLDVWLQEDQ